MDITVRVGEEGVHPFTYATQELIEEEDDVNLQRLVREYEPEREMVVTLYKEQDKVSSYQT